MPANRHGIASLLMLCAFVLLSFTSVAQDTSPLATAESARLIGDYAAAATAYETALNDPATACDALYGFGKVQYHTSQYDEAIATFTRYLAECPDPFGAQVLRARAYQQIGDSGAALADYELAIGLAGSLDSYLYEQMAALDTDRGLYYLRLAAESPRNEPGQFALQETLARGYLLVGNTDRALAQYDLLLQTIDRYIILLQEVEGAEFDENGSLRARLAYAAAQIEQDQGATQAAYSRLQGIITNYPESDVALPALIDLIVGGQAVDLLVRMRINVDNENYFPVVDVLVNLLANPDTSATAPVELFLLLGRAQRGRGTTDAALATFNRVVTEFPNAPEASTALLELGQTHSQLGDSAQALQAYQTLIATYPNAPELPDALLSAAQIQRAQGNTEEAFQLYRALAEQFPEAEQTQETIFDVALALANSDPARAAQLLALTGTARGLLWQGNILQEMGDLAGANQAWQAATTAESPNFFAMQACARLSNLDLYAPATTIQLAPITEQEQTEAAAWVAQTFGLEAFSPALSPELANHPTLQRGLALWDVGLWAQARAEFDALHTLNRNNPEALLQLAFYYQTIPVYRSSLFSATRLVFASQQPFTQIPKGLLRLAYPIYFDDLLIPLAQEYELDPLLVAALVRQESSFDPTARSIAGASGLMQLMPATAQDTASRLGIEAFVLTDLTRPVVNAQLGTFYLRSMYTFQGESVPGALLSYNAGPGAALSWVQSAGDDALRLYETITFDETRLYLELITQNYVIYKFLYGEGVPSCMFAGAAAT